MGNREEFEKWWCETGIKFITEKTACFESWQARQPEIDALKHKLAVTDDGFKAAETLLKNLESENAALKAEVERLRTDAERYRWLRDEDNCCVDALLDDSGCIKDMENLDIAIDAAMKEKK